MLPFKCISRSGTRISILRCPSFISLLKRPFNEDSPTKFENSAKFKAFKSKQAKMQCDDGYPVHLKGGAIDKILYHATVGTCILGVSQSLWLIYTLAVK